ncbi:MAG: GNAT family N-acetyltransferase [Gammaproteobacteria bacterium]
MALAALQNQSFEIESHQGHHLHVGLAISKKDIEAAQRLRYQMFVEEMGARISCKQPGMESDRFDPYCQHLLVRDLNNDQVAGCYRILTDTQAIEAGGFYSQTEFDLSNILTMPARIMEVGRTCVHPNYRNGSTIGLLWAGLTRYMDINNFDYMMGCASIPMSMGVKKVAATYHYLRDNHLGPDAWRATPRLAVPGLDLFQHDITATPSTPPLLKAYMRLGAVICGEPAWDPHINVADMLILLDRDRLDARYVRHFVNRAA